VQCTFPDHIINGHVQPLASTYNVGVSVNFFCMPGFDLKGRRSKTCQSTGEWDSTNPTCQIKTCRDPGTPTNGERRGSDFEFGSSVIFTCDDGFKLVGTPTAICNEAGEWSAATPSC
ncbi:hypothetical protein CAPTEDRAFT_39548, partial [Capitella teleta]